MIGQSKNIDILVKWRCLRSIPRFILLEGPEGSGRLTFAKAIMKQLNATGVICENSIDSVRTTIENAYNITSTTVYIFRNIENMSVEAKNSLLKVVEEPPNKAYFIMTTTSVDNTLATIKSRATSLKMQPYTMKELQQLKEDIPKSYYDILTTPGKLLSITPQQVQSALELSSKVFNGLCKGCAGTELLLHLTALKAKDSEEDKVDCSLFLDCFVHNIKCRGQVSSSDLGLMLEHIAVTKVLLNRKSVNKKAAIERMVLCIWEELRSRRD